MQQNLIYLSWPFQRDAHTEEKTLTMRNNNDDDDDVNSSPYIIIHHLKFTIRDDLARTLHVPPRRHKLVSLCARVRISFCICSSKFVSPHHTKHAANSTHTHTNFLWRLIWCRNSLCSSTAQHTPKWTHIYTKSIDRGNSIHLNPVLSLLLHLFLYIISDHHHHYHHRTGACGASKFNLYITIRFQQFIYFYRKFILFNFCSICAKVRYFVASTQYVARLCMVRKIEQKT